MKRIHVAIVGGGASGLMLAATLAKEGIITTVFERGDRVGRKLSATGNGQGNVTNTAAVSQPYFSFASHGTALAKTLISRYDPNALMHDFQDMGLLLITDERGRVYPAGRQASALTDALRFTLAQNGVDVQTGSCVQELLKTNDGFSLKIMDKDGNYRRETADFVVLCVGGNVAKQFGTDGSAYRLAKAFGHTCTPLYPSLVQLKTDVKYTKTLKGIRVADALVSAQWKNADGSMGMQTLQGDIMFTDYGVSGDSIFRLSAYVADKLALGVTIIADFLPQYEESEIYRLLQNKRNRYPSLEIGELLCGFVNNQIARVIMKRAENNLLQAAKLVKAFSLPVTGSLGADMAQVTKGGICMDEVDEQLQSKYVDGLYFAGEVLDIDGACGGFNLQWAYSSARTVAAALQEKILK